MPINLRKLTESEMARFFPHGVSLPQAEYIDALRGLKPGDVAEALRGNVSSRAFKRRMTLAAKHLGLALRYAREAGLEVVRFQVRQPRGARAALPAATDTPRRRGRPRKVVQPPPARPGSPV
jgi:hypothetical protein